ncbi:MAG: hypothetical protein M1815_001655 [Lichina confinis]|nr:MAG: hypothetical protein M1815_001655 [Lichina confinis]
MDVEKDLDEDSKGLPTRLFDRLDQIPGYSWHRHVPPSRSSYDSWQVSGLRYLRIRRAPGVARRDGCEAKEVSNYSPMSPSRPPLKPAPIRASSSGPDLPPDEQTGPIQVTAEKVLARISTHVLRLEREYHLCRSLLETANPDCKHVVQPLELVRLSSQPGDGAPIVVSISKWPGNNYLQELVGAGTAFHASVPPWHRDLVEAGTPPQKMSLLHFLDFAIGASECLELLHHGQRTVHGELRGDAFHFNKETGVVKLKHFGSGPLSFEHGLTSVGWSTLSKEVGVKSKLQFIAPEQTGRMAAVPDSRTDLYSLGVLFWVILAGEPVFDGSTPMETVQNVLSKRIPPVSTKRLDIPDVISEIIQKMTSKHIGGRYHSASGLKYDLLKLQKILSDRDGEALNSFKIATRDVSSRFNLPKIMVGRRHEHEQVVGIIQKVYRRYSKGSRETIHGVGPHAAFSDGRTDSLEINDGSSDDMSSHSVLCSRGNSESIVPAASHGTFHDQAGSSGFVTAMPLPQPGNPAPHQSSSLEDGPFLPTRSSDAKMLSQDSHDLSRRSSRMYRSLGRCEVISITGAAGLGKSYLVQSVQSVARGFGYLASAKFDPAKKQPFEPVLKVMSSLFSQMFSEGDVTTEFHQLVRAYVAPVSSLLQTMLDIPQHLLGEGASPRARPTSMSKSQPLEATVSFLRGGSSAKSMKPSSTFLDILRLLARHKFICLCFDDLQFADEESLNLISSIIASRMPLVVIVTYREQEMLGERVRCILESDKAHLTRIQLGPLSEDDIIDYVAAALYRPRDYVIPLAAVIQEKTAGNPFLLREVLDACHRRHCVWFDFKSSSWVYDLDLVFKEFEADSYGEILNNDFILRRLNELPTAARVILAWASLLGNAFSFSLVQKLTSGEFDAVDSDDSPQEPASAARLGTLSSPKLDTVAGLHAALQACILIPGDDEDQFR